MVDPATKPVLAYWKIRGLAQSIRLQLAHQGVDFEDKYYEVHSEGKNEDGSEKWSTKEWTDVKFNLGLDFPNLPYFIDGDFSITETVAVHRYIAAKWAPELLGSTPQVTGYVDMVWNVIHPLRF